MKVVNAPQRVSPYGRQGGWLARQHTWLSDIPRVDLGLKLSGTVHTRCALYRHYDKRLKRPILPPP